MSPNPALLEKFRVLGEEYQIYSDMIFFIQNDEMDYGAVSGADLADHLPNRLRQIEALALDYGHHLSLKIRDDGLWFAERDEYAIFIESVREIHE